MKFIPIIDMDVSVVPEIISSFREPYPIAVALTTLAKFCKLRKSCAASDVSCIQHRMTCGIPKPKTIEKKQQEFHAANLKNLTLSNSLQFAKARSSSSDSNGIRCGEVDAGWCWGAFAFHRCSHELLRKHHWQTLTKTSLLHARSRVWDQHRFDLTVCAVFFLFL